jgi:hypothetical protein
MIWVNTELAASTDQPDDVAARELLQTQLSGSGLSSAYPEDQRPVMGGDVGVAQAVLAQLSPMAEVAFKLLASANIKAQARGRVPRKAHEWVDQVISVDLSKPGEWLLMNSHLPLGVAAGIDVTAMIAFRQGRLADLSSEDRQQILFIRAVIAGELTQTQWHSQVKAIGSDRGVVEQICLIFQILCRVRITQALGGGGLSDAELDELIGGFRDGTALIPDIAAYEKFYDEQPFPFHGR